MGTTPNRGYGYPDAGGYPNMFPAEQRETMEKLDADVSNLISQVGLGRQHLYAQGDRVSISSVVKFAAVNMSVDTAEGLTWESNNQAVATVAGIYVVTVNADYVSSTAGTRGLAIYVNSNLTFSENVSPTGLRSRINVGGVLALSVGDAVSLRTFQNSGSALSGNFKLGIVKVA